MDKFRKFLLKLSNRDRKSVKSLLNSVKHLDVEGYDVKALKGLKGVYRLRKGKIRIVFLRSESRGILLDIDFRKDIYKKNLSS